MIQKDASAVAQQAEGTRVPVLDRKYSRVSTFSSGMKSRLALARALLHDPRLIVIPANILILLGLFVVGSGYAPMALVTQNGGFYAQQFYEVMEGAHSFRLHKATELASGRCTAGGD